MLYHTQLGVPQQVKEQLPFGTFRLTYTNHAKKAAAEDRYGIAYALPSQLNTGKARLIEVEVNNGKIEKLLYRMVISISVHLCVAVIPDGRNWLVKTVWGQAANDNHKTLNVERYASCHARKVCH